MDINSEQRNAKNSALAAKKLSSLASFVRANIRKAKQFNDAALYIGSLGEAPKPVVSERGVLSIQAELAIDLFTTYAGHPPTVAFLAKALGAEKWEIRRALDTLHQRKRWTRISKVSSRDAGLRPVKAESTVGEPFQEHEKTRVTGKHEHSMERRDYGRLVPVRQLKSGLYEKRRGQPPQLVQVETPDLFREEMKYWLPRLGEEYLLSKPAVDSYLLYLESLFELIVTFCEIKDPFKMVLKNWRFVDALEEYEPAVMKNLRASEDGKAIFEIIDAKPNLGAFLQHITSRRKGLSFEFVKGAMSEAIEGLGAHVTNASKNPSPQSLYEFACELFASLPKLD